MTKPSPLRLILLTISLVLVAACTKNFSIGGPSSNDSPETRAAKVSGFALAEVDPPANNASDIFDSHLALRIKNDLHPEVLAQIEKLTVDSTCSTEAEKDAVWKVSRSIDHPRDLQIGELLPEELFFRDLSVKDPETKKIVWPVQCLIQAKMQLKAGAIGDATYELKRRYTTAIELPLMLLGTKRNALPEDGGSMATVYVSPNLQYATDPFTAQIKCEDYVLAPVSSQLLAANETMTLDKVVSADSLLPKNMHRKDPQVCRTFIVNQRNGDTLMSQPILMSLRDLMHDRWNARERTLLENCLINLREKNCDMNSVSTFQCSVSNVLLEPKEPVMGCLKDTKSVLLAWLPTAAWWSSYAIVMYDIISGGKIRKTFFEGKGMRFLGRSGLNRPSFVKDFSEQMRNEKVVYDFPPEDFQALRDALANPEVANPIITGDAGSGKTKLAEAFVRAVGEGKFPEFSKNQMFLTIDKTNFDADTKYVGEHERRIKALVRYAKENNAIIFIDEIHQFRGSGRSKNVDIDFFDQLKTQLANGSVRMFGTTTPDEYFRYIGNSDALRRRFPQVFRYPATGPDVVIALKGWASANGRPKLRDEVLSYIVEVSQRYSSEGTPIVRATGLASDIYAKERSAGLDPRTVTIADVDRFAAAKYRLNPAEVDPKLREEVLQSFMTNLNKRMGGLEPIKQSLLQLARHSLMRTVDPSRPRGRMLLAGPEGLGQDVLPAAYAEAIRVKSHHIDMNQYNTNDGVERLKIDLAKIAVNHPSDVVVFNHIEDAHPLIQNGLASLMKTPRFEVEVGTRAGDINVDGGKRRVNTFGLTVFFTTKAGAESLRNAKGQLVTQELQAIMAKHNVSDELLRTIPTIHAFSLPRTQSEFEQLVAYKTEVIIEDLAKVQNMDLRVSNKDQLVKALATKYFNPKADYAQISTELSDIIGNGLLESLTHQSSRPHQLEFNVKMPDSMSPNIAPSTTKASEVGLGRQLWNRLKGN